MVKNLSNPLNARKVGQILADDCSQSGVSIDARDISVFLSDHRISDMETALKQLKQEKLLPPDYFVSDACRSILLEQDFIDEHHQVTQEASEAASEGMDLLGDINAGTIEFKTQLESLKTKLVKTSSGGISIDGHELDNFDRKFGRPMKYFTEYMGEKGKSIGELQAFAVVYATDHLSLGDNSKDDVYHLMFGRFDSIKKELAEHFGFRYSWPVASGTSFINMGKNYSIAPELAEFAKKFRGISGLDTYPDEVIQVFFYNLISGPLLEEMISKKIIYRWAEESDTVTDPLRWLLPPPDFNMDRSLRELMTQAVIVDTLLFRIDPGSTDLLSLLNELKGMDRGTRESYLAKKVEAALTRKSVALQFGTTLANFFENFKTNPAKVPPFLDTTLRYFGKTETVTTLLNTVEHSIRTALKNSTGILRQYLRQVADEELVGTIRSNLQLSIANAVRQNLPDFAGTVESGNGVDYDRLDDVLRSLDDDAVKAFFTQVFDHNFGLVNQYAKSFEQEKEEPQSTEGGLTELTQDFLSTAIYHGSKNWQLKTSINNMVENGLTNKLAERICYISSYITYQVASKEGSNGEMMLMSLIKHYESKAHTLGGMELLDGTKVKDEKDRLLGFLTEDLQQAHAVVALASKIKTDTYNAWTPLTGVLAKHTRYINEFLVPNMLYWQRQPRSFIMNLVNGGMLAKSSVKDMVRATNRMSLLEPYSLLVMGTRGDINSLTAARSYLTELFQSDESTFEVNPRTGEAEITRELIYLWLNLQEVSL